jgi:hypothetical protein
MGFHEVPWDSMRFYNVLVNRSVPTEANRGLTSYIDLTFLNIPFATTEIVEDLFCGSNYFTLPTTIPARGC